MGFFRYTALFLLLFSFDVKDAEANSQCARYFEILNQFEKDDRQREVDREAYALEKNRAEWRSRLGGVYIGLYLLGSLLPATGIPEFNPPPRPPAHVHIHEVIIDDYGFEMVPENGIAEDDRPRYFLTSLPDFREGLQNR